MSAGRGVCTLSAQLRLRSPRCLGNLLGMRDVSSPVLDPADAGRGQLRALQALLGLSLLVL